jgi:pimeloyl-ACP methyl ester carboxylesterase
VSALGPGDARRRTPVTLVEPERLGVSRLADGRVLGWAQWGPADGVPVLFFGGAAAGRSLGFGADVLATRDVRLIAVERPGLGVSSPSPGRTLASWADDIAQLIAGLALRDVRIVGFSQGGPFALACAADGLADKVAIVSGQDVLDDPAFAGKIDPKLAQLLQAVRADPDGVEAAFAGSASAALLWELIAAHTAPVDLALYRAPEFEPLFQRSLAEGFAQGAAGYARDLVLTLRPWPFQLSEIRARVHLWYGALDTSTVHSPDLGATLARRLPDARHHVVPEAGGSLLWTHADAILSALVA